MTHLCASHSDARGRPGQATLASTWCRGRHSTPGTNPSARKNCAASAPIGYASRRLAGGVFAPNETRHYDLIGPANYASTGGNPAGCGIPATTTPVTNTTYGNRVRSLVLNLTAVFPTANGNLRAWPTNQATPLASVLNYSPTMYAVANGLALQTCDAAVAAAPPA